MGSADPNEEDSPALLFAGWGGWSRRSGGASRKKEEERWRAGPKLQGCRESPPRACQVGVEARGQSRPQARSGRERAHLAAVHVEEQLRRPVHAGAARRPAPESPTALPPEPTRQPSPREKAPLKTQNSVRLAAKACADPRTSRERSGRAEIIGRTLPSSRRLPASTPRSPPLGRCARSCGVSLVVFHWCIF